MLKTLTIANIHSKTERMEFIQRHLKNIMLVVEELEEMKKRIKRDRTTN